MSAWIVVGLLLNIAIVTAAVVLVLRLAGPRSIPGALDARAELHWQRRTIPAPASPRDPPRPQRLNPTDTRRVEWLALLEAFESARSAYVEELATWHTVRRRYGALSRTKHALDVARKRLNRFERERVLRA